MTETPEWELLVEFQDFENATRADEEFTEQAETRDMAKRAVRRKSRYEIERFTHVRQI